MLHTVTDNLTTYRHNFCSCEKRGCMKYYKVQDKYFKSENQAGKYADEVGAFLITVINDEHSEYQTAKVLAQ